MLQKFVFTLSLFTLHECVYGQDWALVYGNCASTLAPTYGTLGVSSPTANPGGRTNACAMKDASGNLWHFGGLGYISPGVSGYFNDLWRYTITTNEWTWMKGANYCNQLPTYGTKGVPSPSNDPGARRGSISWTDATGNFWVFGGETSLNISTISWCLNDLWKYNVSTNQWTWMSGTNSMNDNGVFGTQGVSSTASMPRSRANGVSWVDANGNLWLFGGTNVNGNSLNDLWMYNPANNEWTWVSGSMYPNAYSVYGTIGVSAPANVPSARMASCSWTDNSGSLWLFGGSGYGSSATYGNLNDLWKFNIGTNQWTWMHGASTSSTSPNGRYGASSWKDLSGNFWIFGGTGSAGNISELWHYSVPLNQWVLVKPHAPGMCYAYGIASPYNLPPPSYKNTSWTDNCGNLWLYGGDPGPFAANPFYNALWKLNLGGARGTQALNICNGASATISVTGGGTINWYSSPGSTVSLGTGSVYLASGLSTGSYSYYAEPSTCSFGNTRTEVRVDVHAPTLSVSGAGSLCIGATLQQTVSGADTYTWSNGSTSSVIAISPTITTQYTVSGKDVYGCPGNSTGITVTVYSVPLITVSGSNTVCMGSTLTKTISGANTYSWSSGAITASVSLNPTVNTTYTAYGTSTNNCTSKSIFSVSVLATPALSVNSGTICATKIFTIIPSGAVSYSYSSITNTVSPASSTVYTVSGSAANGCVANAGSTVVVNPLPLISAANGSICPGQSFTINPAGAGTYTFSSNTPIVSPLITTTVFITGTSGAGCLSQSPTPVEIRVLANPTVSVNSGPLCIGQSFSMQASGAFSYTYSGGSPVVTPTINTSYTVVGTSFDGCVSQPAVCHVTIVQLPALSINGNFITCSGEPVILTASGTDSFVWYPNVPGSTITVSPLVSSGYSVTGTNTLTGCSGTAAITVSTIPLPTIGLYGDLLLCQGNTGYLYALGGDSYLWSNSGTGTTTSIAPVVNTTYTVVGTSSVTGCKNFAVGNVTLTNCTSLGENSGVDSYVTLSPNPNHGLFTIESQKQIHISIFNQLGILVYENVLITGKHSINLETLPNGVYYVSMTGNKNTSVVKLLKVD